MGLLDRFFGAGGASSQHAGPLAANPNIENPLGLQLLLAEPRPLDSATLARALQKLDRSMGGARCEIDAERSRDGRLVGLAGWGPHVVRFLGFDAPMPAAAVEACVAPAHYSQELKAHARAHRAHMLLYYAGHDASALEQCVALAATAAVIGRQGALVVLNESARTSLPVRVLSDLGAQGKTLAMLRELPLPYLYCGFVKHEVEDVRGVWMRTYGAPRLGLPDLAMHAAGHGEAQRHFDMFDNVFRYVLDSRARLSRGHTLQIGTHYLRVRAPKLSESFLTPEGELFVLEAIRPDDINR